MKRSLLLIIFLLSTITKAQSQNITAPPNSVSVISINNHEIEIMYNNISIFKGSFGNETEINLREVNGIDGEAVNQLYIITSNKGGAITLSGFIEGTEESFPCEADRKIEDNDDLVRNSIGLSNSLLNRAVYDRKYDWVLSVDYPASVKIVPVEESNFKNKFEITITGSEIPLRFRPRYYQKHRDLKYFEPWTYKVWNKPVVGWCSWFAYFSDVNEEKMKIATDFISEKLKPFGAEYIQIDDGFQKVPIGMPETWLEPNKKFPSGMNGLAKYILGKGLQPGVWTNVSFADKEAAFVNKNLFVPDAEGNPARGRWVGYVMDGSKKETIDKLIRPVYNGFKKMGWNYFKVDALRHLRYEGYNSSSDYFKKNNVDRVEIFRGVVKSIREEVGNSFMMGCWGIRPELIGLIDGCRIGGDGYGWESLTQYNSFNNLVWKNDPDHIELSDQEAYRSCSATSLTGSLFMLTDKPEIYSTPIVEAAIRSIPVLHSLPAQLYDVDPSRSSQLNRVDYEMSGDGARVFDASRSTPYDLFLLEINKPFENWMTLGRMGEHKNYVEFSKLGLDSQKEYLVFEFWTKNFEGSFNSGFSPSMIDPKFNCQVFTIRERKRHPQLLATNRHITCGAFELSDLKWNEKVLTGKSEVVEKDTYIIYLFEPDEYSYKEFLCDGVKVIDSLKTGNIREIKLVSETSKQIEWKAIYN